DRAEPPEPGDDPSGDEHHACVGEQDPSPTRCGGDRRLQSGGPVRRECVPASVLRRDGRRLHGRTRPRASYPPRDGAGRAATTEGSCPAWSRIGTATTWVGPSAPAATRLETPSTVTSRARPGTFTARTPR